MSLDIRGSRSDVVSRSLSIHSVGINNITLHPRNTKSFDHLFVSSLIRPEPKAPESPTVLRYKPTKQASLRYTNISTNNPNLTYYISPHRQNDRTKNHQNRRLSSRPPLLSRHIPPLRRPGNHPLRRHFRPRHHQHRPRRLGRKHPLRQLHCIACRRSQSRYRRDRPQARRPRPPPSRSPQRCHGRRLTRQRASKIRHRYCLLGYLRQVCWTSRV